jgi:oligosaccharyltransferase complex subunit alpha (ribophorin I)
MLQRWRRLPVFFVGFIVPSLASPQSFENTAIVRTVELGGSLVYVTTTYATKALEANSKVYTVALGVEERRRTSWLEAKIKGQSNPLVVEDHGYDPSTYVRIRRNFLYSLIFFFFHLVNTIYWMWHCQTRWA